MPSGVADKYLLVQTRLIWFFSALSRLYPDKVENPQAARQGVDFLIKYLWDNKDVGWFCSVKRD